MEEENASENKNKKVYEERKTKTENENKLKEASEGRKKLLITNNSPVASESLSTN